MIIAITKKITSKNINNPTSCRNSSPCAGSTTNSSFPNSLSQMKQMALIFASFMASHIPIVALLASTMASLKIIVASSIAPTTSHYKNKIPYHDYTNDMTIMNAMKKNVGLRIHTLWRKQVKVSIVKWYHVGLEFVLGFFLYSSVGFKIFEINQWEGGFQNYVCVYKIYYWPIFNYAK